jgi:hypothetical protein
MDGDFVPGPYGTERMWGYKGWVAYPMDHTIVSHKYFYQSAEHWSHVKCRGEDRERALRSFAAGDAVSNTHIDTSLKKKRDGRMKLLHPTGARLLMDRARRCLSWQTYPGLATDHEET